MTKSRPSICVLALAPRGEDADLLLSQLYEHFDLDEKTESAKSVHEALMILMKGDFDLICIGENVPKQMLEGFFVDLKKIEQNKGAIIILVKETIWPTDNRKAMAPSGFSGAVQRKIAEEDSRLLVELLAQRMHQKEVALRVREVEQAIKRLFDELDLVARERKRGWKRTFNTLSSEHVERLSKFDPTILEAYFEKLALAAADKKPESSEPLAPTEPGMYAGELNVPYKGASARVWDKILKARAREGEK